MKTGSRKNYKKFFSSFFHNKNKKLIASIFFNVKRGNYTTCQNSINR